VPKPGNGNHAKSRNGSALGMTKAVSTNSEGVYSVQSKMELGGAENFVAQRIFCRFDRGRVNDHAKKSVVEI
jgi:hypothetical protein